MTALLFFLLALAPAAGPADLKPSPRQQELDDQLAAKAAALQALSDGMLECAERLRAVRESYSPDRDPAEQERARAAVLKEVKDRMDELNAELGAFQSHHYEYQFARGVAVIGRHLQGERPEMVAGIDWISRGKEFMKSAVEARGEMNNQLIYDQRDWKFMLDSRAARRRRRWVIWGGLSLLAGGAALGLRLSRGARPASPAVLAALPEPAALAAPPAQTAPSRCRIVRELKPGPLGAAYEAADRRTGKRLFLKSVHAELCADPAPFLECGRALEALRHPRIAAVESVFAEGGKVHALGEWVEGQTLHARVARQGPVPAAQARALLSQACAAVEHARAAGLLHGDLRCAKLLLAADGVKVCDFGLGLVARRAAARVSWRRAFGSPAYLAPEQERDESSPRSDVFALGVIAYRMLTGRLPFEGPNFPVQKREGRYPPPSRLVPGLPTVYDALIARCLAEDPARRFASAGELGAGLPA